MTTVLIDFRNNVAAARPAIGVRPKIKPRDLVTWTNPATRAEWCELRVEFVYASLGIALVRGCFGRMSPRTGDLIVESRTLPLSDLTVTGRAEEVQS